MKQRTILGHQEKIAEAIEFIKEIEKDGSWLSEGQILGQIFSIKKKITKRKAAIRRMLKAEEARAKAREEALAKKALQSK